MAKKIRESKLDEVDKFATSAGVDGFAPARKQAGDDKRGGRAEGASPRKKQEGCIIKFHRDPADMIPPFAVLTKDYPALYSKTHVLRHLSEQDVGKFICIEAEATNIPDSLRATLDDPFLMTGSYLLLRQTMFDILQALTEIAGDAPKSAKGAAIGVHGQRGGGKTALLNMLAVFALQDPQEWLLLATRGEEFYDRFAWGTETLHNQRRSI
jgi:hypothetical protein